MANASYDNNNIPTILGTSNGDGATPVKIKVNPTTHILQTLDGTTGSDLGGSPARRDDNYNTVLMGVSSADGTAPTAIYADTNGNLLIKST